MTTCYLVAVIAKTRSENTTVGEREVSRIARVNVEQSKNASGRGFKLIARYWPKDRLMRTQMIREAIGDERGADAVLVERDWPAEAGKEVINPITKRIRPDSTRSWYVF